MTISEMISTDLIISAISFSAGVITILSFLYVNYKYGVVNMYHLHQLDKEMLKLYAESEKVSSDDAQTIQQYKEKLKELKLAYFYLKLNSSNLRDQQMAIIELYQLSKDKVYDDSTFEILVRRVGSSPPLSSVNKIRCLKRIKDLCKELYCPEKGS